MRAGAAGLPCPALGKVPSAAARAGEPYSLDQGLGAVAFSVSHLGLFPLGWAMVGVPLSALLLKFVLYQLHKTLGILVLALTTARLPVRARGGRPAWDADMPGWQRRAASFTHGLLCALLVAAPVLGYLTAATAPARVPTLFLGVVPVPHLVRPAPGWFSRLRQVHRGVAVLLVVLAGGHAVAAIHNHLRGRGILVRMWRGEAPRLLAEERSAPLRRPASRARRKHPPRPCQCPRKAPGSADALRPAPLSAVH